MKEYFVLSTNVDGQFYNSGFDKNKVFEVQGDYSYLQCENACHNKLYNNRDLGRRVVTKYKRLPNTIKFSNEMSHVWWQYGYEFKKRCKLCSR